jgi:hypothetical protein
MQSQISPGRPKSRWLTINTKLSDGDADHGRKEPVGEAEYVDLKLYALAFRCDSGASLQWADHIVRLDEVGFGGGDGCCDRAVERCDVERGFV